MRVFPAPALVVGVDTVATLLGATCAALVDDGFRFRAGYLDAVTPLELEHQLEAGLPFFAYGYANQFDGAHLLERVTALGLPLGCTVVLDVEGVTIDADALIQKLDHATGVLQDGGCLVGGYFGAQQPLTSEEMSELKLTRYVKSCSRVVDRFGNIAEPHRGWCAVQGRPPNAILHGVKFDVTFVQEDYHGDVLTLVG